MRGTKGSVSLALGLRHFKHNLMYPFVLVGVIDRTCKFHFSPSGLFVQFTLKYVPMVVYEIDFLSFTVEAAMVGQRLKVPIAIFGGFAVVSSSWVWPSVARIRGLLVDVCGCTGDKKKRQDGKEGHKLFHVNPPWSAVKAETKTIIAQARRIMGVFNLSEGLCSHRREVLRMQE